MNKLSDFIAQNKTDYQTIQRMFLDISLISYFDFISDKAKDYRFLIKFNAILPYTDADENYIVDLDKTICREICDINETILVDDDDDDIPTGMEYDDYVENLNQKTKNFNPNITIGEMLQIARKMIYCDRADICDPVSAELYEKKKDIGRKIVHALMIEPFEHIYSTNLGLQLADLDEIIF